jgi:hypothetical protein
MSTSLEALCDLTRQFGQRPGTDRFLVERSMMEDWIHRVAGASDRIRISSIGPSTGGREMWLVAVSSPETIRSLDQVRDRRQALVDAAHADGPVAGNKPVVLITAGIHATEIGGVQLMPELLAELATSGDDRIQGILESTILLIVPTLNPDGMDQVHAWYEGTRGTPAEGAPLPEPYHRYAGHDNNRDWYTHALAETRNVVDNVHRRWYPHVLLDLHQMGEHAPRYMVPPFIDPVEPHVHPLITSLTSSIGSMLATAHHRAGHQGVASGVMFDSYSPTRSFVTHHGGVRILAEAASARLASPSTVEPVQLSSRRGFDARKPGVRNPMPWTGGTWRLRDIMDYHKVTIHALLDWVEANAGLLVRDQWRMLREDAEANDRPIYAISPLRQQIDPRAAKELALILERGGITPEIVETGDEVIAKGSIIVRSAHPFGRYASALLDLTPYPESRSTPYDVTSHCLPVHMGVEVRAYPADTVVETRPMTEGHLDVFPGPSAADADRGRWLAVDHRGHASIRIIARALANGATVYRLMRPHFDDGRMLQPGTWLVAGEHALDAISRARRETVRSWRIGPVGRGTARQRMPGIGVYVPWSEEAIDTGWLRLMLEHSGLPYRLLRNDDLREGNLNGIDVVLFADQEPTTLPKGTDEPTWPDMYRGGIGATRMGQLLDWTTSGGTVVAIDGAARALAAPLGAPIRFPLASMPEESFAAPGSIVRVVPDASHPLMLGIEDPFPVMLQGNNAFASRKPKDDASFAARFGSDDPLVSGWLRGADLLAGLGAVADHDIGRGRLVSFAFRPHFRTQMLASYAPLINAIMRAGLDHGESQ